MKNVYFIDQIDYTHSYEKTKSLWINICKFTGPNGESLGCVRTRDEAMKWKKLKPYDIKIIQKLYKEE